jgi:hypothetical protein
MRYRMLSADGDYVFGNGPGEFLVNTPATVAQAIVTRLKLWQGEWFLDSQAGTPYKTQVLGYGTQNVYDAAIQTIIINTLGVNQITEYSSSFNTTTRALTIEATVATIYGTTTINTTL